MRPLDEVIVQRPVALDIAGRLASLRYSLERRVRVVRVQLDRLPLRDVEPEREPIGAGSIDLVYGCEGDGPGVREIHGALAVHHVAVVLTQGRQALDLRGHRFGEN